jgi:hypothetical protein
LGAEDAVAGGLVGGLITGSVAYKLGYAAGYRKREDEDKWYIGTLEIQLLSANQTVENLRREIERLQKENETLRTERSLIQRVKGVLTQ